MENNKLRALAMNTLGLAISIIPVLVTATSYFPIWARRGGAYVISGFAVILCILALSPLIKFIKEALKSPSSYMLWLMTFLLFLLLSRIADEMTVISFVGFISNLIGAFFFKAAKKYRCKEEDT